MQSSRVWSRFIKLLLKTFLRALEILFALFFCQKKPNFEPIEDVILLKPATVLSESIKTGKLSSEQVVESYIRQIKKVNPVINAVVFERFDKALERAREIDALLLRHKDALTKDDDRLPEDVKWLKSPLVGVPFTIKETIGLAGAPYTAGVVSRRFRVCTGTNLGVKNLIEKGGMIPLATTNTPCMNKWFDSNNHVYGWTKNPYDLSRTPGGSTGGEGAILGAGGSCIGVGSDLAGSIRIPASFCGVFGHKPTPGIVPGDYSYPVWRKEHMFGIGPLTKFACDLKPALEMMVADKLALQKLNLNEPVDLSKIKLYYCYDLGDPLVDACNSEVRRALVAAVEHLKSKYQIESKPVKLDEFRYGMALWSAELAGDQIYTNEHPDGLTQFSPIWEFFKYLLGLSEYPLATILCVLVEKCSSKKDSSKQLYLSKRAVDLRDRFNKLVGDNGVLMMPTHPEPPPVQQLTLFKFFNATYTAVVNILQAPVTQTPVGTSRDGLPIGIQLISSPYNDRLTIAVACELDKAFSGWQPPVKAS